MIRMLLMGVMFIPLGTSFVSAEKYTGSDLRIIGSGQVWHEVFEVRCPRWQNVCSAKEINFGVAAVASSKISLFVSDACGPLKVKLNVVNDEGVEIASFETPNASPGGRYLFATTQLGPLHTYRLSLIAEGGYECQDGYLPRWNGEVMLEQGEATCNHQDLKLDH
jgi:hypothetical protein